MNRKLPIGVQDFEDMRQSGYIYVDKTAYVYRMVHEGKAYFLSRPRRFGKSLLVSTLRAYFEGKRELFEGLDVARLEEDNPDAWQPRPVIHIDFTGEDYTTECGLDDKLDAVLSELELMWPPVVKSKGAGSRLLNVLKAAHEATGRRCVVLVDEYDKPMLEVMHDLGLEERNRNTLRGFFSALKGGDHHLDFVLLTGVTKFSKVSIFSDLNQLRDISLESAYAGVCGITQDELLCTFSPEVDAMAASLRMSRDECLDALREQYDGYCFHPKGPETQGAKVYNPFSLLNALASRRLGSWWFQTGTPTFLARRMRDAGLEPSRLVDGSIYATERRLSDYRADDPDPVPLLYQSGYLTIAGHDLITDVYELAIPNNEVRDGLLEVMLPTWAPSYSSSQGTDVFTLHRLVEAGDTDGIRRVLAALFASIPYTRAGDPFENYFQAVVWLVFTMLGRYVRCEVHQAAGRADCVVEAARHVYVLEFKRGGTAGEALAQARRYAGPYAADPRELHLVGCAFDPDTRQLSGWAEAPR